MHHTEENWPIRSYDLDKEPFAFSNIDIPTSIITPWAFIFVKHTNALQENFAEVDNVNPSAILLK